MKLNHSQHAASLRLFLGVVLAGCLFATTAHAQSRPLYKGTFKLTQEVHWRTIAMGPGAYLLAIDQFDPNYARTITISDARTGKIVVHEVARTDSNTENGDSKLLIVREGNQRAVYSARLAGLGEVFRSTEALEKARGSAKKERTEEAVLIGSSAVVGK
jgi:hypothetical protein